MALISIVIPVHNAAETLPATLRSIQAQTWPHWEVILVDDGSSDNSYAVAVSFAREDARIKVVANLGLGPSAARNHGALDVARGDIISFCDADDLWLPAKLGDVAEELLAGDADATFGIVRFFSTRPEEARSRSSVPRGALTVPMLLAENPLCTLSNLSVRREAFADVGGFREDLVHNEDLDFLVRLAGMGFVVEGCQAEHVLYRLSPGGLSANLDAMRDSRRQVVRTALGLGFPADPRSEARYLRYLARRAMRLDAPRQQVQGFVLEGVRSAPCAFLHPFRRGGSVALGAMLMPLLPRGLRRFLFSK